MYQALIGSFIRHALTSVGGALVAKGLLTAATVEPFVGAAMTLGGIILSVIQKYRSAN